MKIISLGEILWDVFDDGEHLGGAPFNFAAHARLLGNDVSFISAVGDDERGRAALARAQELGLRTQFIRKVSDHPTGVVRVTVDSSGQPRFVICRPAAYDFVSLAEKDLQELTGADWIYFGTLHQSSPNARDVLAALIRSNPRARRFYDVNLRRDCYDAALVRRLLEVATVVKLNDEEAGVLGELFGGHGAISIEQFCRENASTCGWEAVCVTHGAAGCSLLIGNEFFKVAGYRVRVADTVGAGDAFAAAFLHGITRGWSPEEIGDFANRVGALISSRRGAIPPWTVEEAKALTR